MKIHSILLSIVILSISSCSNTTSFAFIGLSHKAVLDSFDDPSYFKGEFTKRYITKDTILIGFYQSNAPFETMYVFHNDTCYYQDTKIYCSPCAEKALEDILNDKYYKFVQIDHVNYMSSTYENVILRVKKEDIDIAACTELQIINTSVMPDSR